MQHRPPDKVPTFDDSGARKGTGDKAAATTAAARVQLLDNHGSEHRNDPRSSLSSISGPTSPVGAAAAATTRQIMEDRHGHDSDNDHTFQKPVPANNAKGKQKQVHELEVTDLKAITSLTNKQRAFLVKGGFISTAEVLFTPIKPLSERLRLPENECRDLVRNIVNDRKKRWISNGSCGTCVGERVRASLGSKTIPEGLGAAGGATYENDTREAAPLLPLLWPGDAGLREIVGGGLVPGTLTELAGEASSGKTALSLQLALRVQLDPSAGGLSGSCVYLSSEGNFPSIRLRDMAFKLSDGTPEGIKTFMDNVHLVHCPEVDELLHAVRYSLPAVVHQLGDGARQQEKSTSSPSRKPVKLVIVDSIAAPFRGSEGGGGGGGGGTVRDPKDGQENWEGGGRSEGQHGMYSLAERNKQLAEIAGKLYRLAKQYSLVVVLCNQVSDVFHKDGDRDRWSFGQTYSQASNNSQGSHHNSTLKSRHDQANEADQVHLSVTHENGGVPLEYRNYKHASRFFSGEEADSRNSKVAVFGLSWANCINTRIMLSRTGRRRRKTDGAQVQALVTLDENGLEVEDPLFALETEEVRRATLIFSPFAEKGHVDYVLRQEGFVSVSQHYCTPRGPVAHNRRGRQRAGAKGTVQKRGRGVKALPLPGFDDVDGEEQEDQGDDDDGDHGDEEDALWAELSREDPNTVLDEATLSQL